MSAPQRSLTEAQGSLRLWQSVIGQALRDIFRTAKSRDGCSDGEHRAALAWIGARDFHKVCALAGLDGTAVEQAVRRRLREREAGTFDPAPIFYQRGFRASSRSTRRSA